VGDGDDDQGDEERDPVASSTSDATVRDAGERAACRRSAPSFRADEVRWETFLHTLKAGPAGGRLRRPPSAGTRSAKQNEGRSRSALDGMINPKLEAGRSTCHSKLTPISFGPGPKPR
jgi:hypothetical protein